MFVKCSYCLTRALLLVVQPGVAGGARDAAADSPPQLHAVVTGGGAPNEHFSIDVRRVRQSFELSQARAVVTRQRTVRRRHRTSDFRRRVSVQHTASSPAADSYIRRFMFVRRLLQLQRRYRTVESRRAFIDPRQSVGLSNRVVPIPFQVITDGARMDLLDGSNRLSLQICVLRVYDARVVHDATV